MHPIKKPEARCKEALNVLIGDQGSQKRKLYMLVKPLVYRAGNAFIMNGVKHGSTNRIILGIDRRRTTSHPWVNIDILDAQK